MPETISDPLRGEVTLDHQRVERLGFDEAIFCLNKSPAQIETILNEADRRGISLLLTRLDPAHHDALPRALSQRIDFDPVSRTGFFDFAHRQKDGLKGAADVAIVTAGTSDVPVAREAARTLAYYGVGSHEVLDVGVAGIWRLMERVEELRRHAVVIAVAGMDAALPSVIGGLLPGLVIAVPTSTGYGISENGMTALRSTLASCAPGLVTVNIDNGYGAACAALRMLRFVRPA